MVNLIQALLPYKVLGLNILTIVLLLCLVFRNSWGRGVVSWVGEKSLWLGFLMAFGAVSGSLFYSSVVGFEPCVLCWWQRIAIFPLLVLFGLALVNKDRSIFRYTTPLAWIALIISIYHSYIQWGGNPLIPCDVEGTCTKLYVYAFSYITIPTMVTSIAIPLILLAIANKIYENRNSR